MQLQVLVKGVIVLNWHWFISTKIFYGKDVLRENAHSFKELGSKALIVTGQGGSPRRNGSLNDTIWALESVGLGWEVFAEVEANPSITTVRRGAATAKEKGADFIIGIGGGSPLDAAKAIAILAVQDIDDEDLFALKFTEVLPIVAIPTTAGTGSEVTPYSIITHPDMGGKMRIMGDKLLPYLAFLDPKYTLELPRQITIDTAVDAYSHVMEGYLSSRSNPFSDILAQEGLALLGEELRFLTNEKELTYENRHNLLYGSMLAGMVITHTGTTIPHTMGYPLTYYKDIPHGRANGMLMPEFMNFTLNNSNNPRSKQVLTYSGFTDLANFTEVMRKLSGYVPELETDEIEEYINTAYEAPNIQNNLAKPDLEDLRNLLVNSIS